VEVEGMTAQNGDAVNDYLSELKTVNNASPAYLRGIQMAMRGFNRSLTSNPKADEHIEVNTVTETDVKRWIGDMRDRGNNNLTVRTNMARLRGFFDFMIESPDYTMAANPCKRLFKKLPSGRTQTRRPYKTVAEVAGLIKSITHPRDRCIITMLAKTGMRRGELVGLDLTDADLDNNILHIRQHRDDGNGELLPGRKNGETTDIPIDEELRRLLQVHIALRPRSNSPALFLTRHGARAYGRDVAQRLTVWVEKHWGYNGKATSERISPHWFRAFLTYELSVNGCNPVVIAAIRGDRAARMQDFYTMQVLGFEKIREEYLKAAPQFGL
jgi:integrase/recombinase XerD